MTVDGVYVISVAAELAGIHPQTLRLWERKGLLAPQRTGTGRRRYSDADIARLDRIMALTQAGVNLEGVKRILALDEEVARLRHEVARLDAQMTHNMAAARQAIAAAERSHRRDLVPLTQTLAPFRRR
jgi:MerR family transcriptional regulator/heat shock protein HspR